MDGKVLITGLGAVSTLGSGVDAFRRGLRAAHSLPVDTADPWTKVPVRRMLDQTAPSSIHCRRSCFSRGDSGGRSLGITSNSMYCQSRLSAALPGTMAFPLLPPASAASFRDRSRRPFLSVGP